MRSMSGSACVPSSVTTRAVDGHASGDDQRLARRAASRGPPRARIFCSRSFIDAARGRARRRRRSELPPRQRSANVAVPAKATIAQASTRASRRAAAGTTIAPRCSRRLWVVVWLLRAVERARPATAIRCRRSPPARVGVERRARAARSSGRRHVVDRRDRRRDVSLPHEIASTTLPGGIAKQQAVAVVAQSVADAPGEARSVGAVTPDMASWKLSEACNDDEVARRDRSSAGERVRCTRRPRAIQPSRSTGSSPALYSSTHSPSASDAAPSRRTALR